MPKELPQHNDLFGQPLAVGDAVVFPSDNAMWVGMVDKLNPKMIKVTRVSTKYDWNKAGRIGRVQRERS